MAFNWKTFQTRTLTAIVFAAVMLVGLLWNHWSFLVLFSVIHFGCWWEYLKLTEKIYHTSFHFYLKLGLMLIGYGLMLWFCGHQYELLGYGIRHSISLPVSIAGFILSLIGIYESKKVQPQGFAAAGLGII
ncbi:MAG TPA: phosphatidate cytidylyltransferase, partial [Chitinophagaceae bacterium]|nr:phosphatidate cytidylyltransferase [Chitinophagaceae bacterium]